MTNPIDLAALAHAIDAARRQSPAEEQRINDRLAKEGCDWFDVATGCAFHCQMTALALQPWQSPPCWASLADLSKPYDDPRGERESAELLRRLLDAGLSRYEPNPVQALERAEAKRQAAR